MGPTNNFLICSRQTLVYYQRDFYKHHKEERPKDIDELTLQNIVVIPNRNLGRLPDNIVQA
jgi:hypothetical protein